MDAPKISVVTSGSRTVRTLSLASALILFAACGSGLVDTGGEATVQVDTGGEATVQLALEQTSEAPVARTARIHALAVTSGRATQFSMKLIAAYITEDIDSVSQSNVGKTGIIYMNSECLDDISHCDIDGGTAEDGLPMDKILTSFFDLSLTEAANTAIRAQGRTVDAGTYRYARLEFCKYDSGTADNIKWDDGVVGEQSFRRTLCTVNSAEMDPPLELAGGDSVTLTLSYDLSTAVQVGSDAVGDDCTGSGETTTCFTLPTFMPSVE
jgi:hypothetical protein